MSARVRRSVVGLAIAGGLAVGGTALANSPGNSNGNGGTVTKGPIPNEAVNEDGTIDPEVAPEFIPVVVPPGHPPGYVRLTDQQRHVRSVGGSDSIPVYAEDLTTQIGRMVDDVGFVANGEVVPDTVPSGTVVYHQ